MLKKLISIAVIAAMICTVFAGCTPEDVALYKALQKTPESCVTHTVMDFDVTVEEPLSIKEQFDEYYTYEDDLTAVNYFIQIVSGLLSITDAEAVITKSGNVCEEKISYTMPDASFSFKAWYETDSNGQATNTVISLPSYVRPFLPLALSQKQYLSYSPAEYMQTVSSLYGATPVPEADMGIIGGADGPASIAITETTMPNPEIIMSMITNALQNEDTIDQFAGLLDINYVSKVEKSAGNTVYTVKLDGQTLKSMVKGIVSTLGKEELAGMISILASVSDEDFKAGLEEADKYVDIICDFIINTGMLDNGMTTVYTVNRDGYVIRTEETMDINYDLPRIYNSAIDMIIQIEAITGEDELTPEDIADIKNSVSLTGKFRIAAKAVSDVTNINEPLTVQMPELTDANCIDIMSDLQEYQAYEEARRAWQYSWYNSSAERAYAMMHQPGEPLTLRNKDTGVEIVTVPKTTAELNPDYNENTYYYNQIYVPITDLAQLFDDVISVTWNGELMGVEVRYISYGDECVDLYLSEAGTELYYNTEYDEENYVYDNYDWVDDWTYSWQFADDGKFYVEPDCFDYDIDYDSRFEDNGYSYISWGNNVFTYEGMEGNFFYEFERMFD